MAENMILNEETQAMLLEYFDAFSNLYGIIPIKRALRIIRKQNPELEMTDEQFSDFISNIDFSHQYYIITSEAWFEDENADSGEPLDRVLAAEYLYSIDCEDYFVLADEQEGRPFYVPNKEELLKYSDEYYFERTKYYDEFDAFLKAAIPIPNNEIAYDIQIGIVIDDNEIDEAVGELRFLSGNKFKDFKNKEQAYKFALLYTKLRNNTRKHAYRGHTPAELGDSYYICEASKEKSEQSAFPQVPKQPSLNGPCPCGSGKKYKRCCGKNK